MGIKVSAIIQARMSSTRLPGKVAKNILGKPMLYRIFERLTYCKKLDKIIIASSINKKDDKIENICKKYNMPIYRGKEQDLIDRFYQTLKILKSEAILRITADCPLVDPKIIDKIIDIYNYYKYDYISNNRPNASWPQGLDCEIISAALIKRLWRNLADSFRREWFTTVIFENFSKYNAFCYKNKRDLSWMRLTVDYKEDLELVRKIYKEFYHDKTYFGLSEILLLYKNNPDIFEINNMYKKDHQYYKELKTKGI